MEINTTQTISFIFMVVHVKIMDLEISETIFDLILLILNEKYCSVVHNLRKTN